MSHKETLKRKLCAAIDDLDDSDGFVLVATTDDVTFTRLKGAGWDEHVLELEPLNIAEARRELGSLWNDVRDSRKRKASLEAEVVALTQRRDDIQAAIANALGGKP